MKKLFILFFFVSSTQLFAIVPTSAEVRKLYQKAAKESNSCKKLINILSSYNEKNNSLLAGYKACATMIMANYLINPYNKYSNFKTGKNLLEKCIAINTENIELRFLRFSIQTNVPSFLGYSNSIKTDKLFLLKSISSIEDLELKTMVTTFLKESEHLTESEKLKLNK